MSQQEQQQAAQLQALQQQIVAQQKLQELMQHLTDTCWDKCIDNIKSPALSSSQEKCMKNCALRYKDVSQHVLEKVQEQA